MSFFRSRNDSPFLFEEGEVSQKKLLETQRRRPAQGQSLQPLSPTVSPYGYGMESIYTPEIVDLNTVRLMGSSVKSMTNDAKEDLLPLTSSEEGSSECDLGEEYRGWMNPLYLEEPIEVLELPNPILRMLKAQGIYRLKELRRREGEDLEQHLGAQFEEVSGRLKRYLNAQGTDPKSHRVDLKSLLRCLLADEEPRVAYLCAEPYGLSHFFRLTPSEEMKLHRLSTQERAKLAEEARKQVRTLNRITFLELKLKEIVAVFIKPWMRRRKGLAFDWEIQERLRKVTLQSEEGKKILAAIKGLFWGEDPIQSQLIPLEKGLYASDAATASLYYEIENLLKSYFYTEKSHYSLLELITLVEREASFSWKSYPEGMVEQVTKRSPAFLVRKGPTGEQEVSLTCFT